MARTTTKPQTKATETEGDEDGEVTLSREEYGLFKELLAERQAVIEFSQELDEEDVTDGPEDEEDEDGEAGSDAVPEQVRLTMEAQSAQILELRNQATAREVDLAVEKLRNEGLAPAIVEAARPLLAMSDSTVELSNGDSVDVREQVEALLTTITELASGGEALVKYDVELGRTDEADPIEARRAKLLEAWDQAVGE